MDYYAQNNILIDDLNSIYFFVPKVACTSIKTVVANHLNLNNFDNRNDLTDVHHKVDFPFVYKDQIKEKYLNYYKFGFVRNPWDRIVSCYKNKITRDPYLNNTTYINGVGVFSFDSNNKNRFFAGMSFASFVDVIASTPDVNADDHFTSQTQILSDSNGNLLPDYIGKFEHIDHDFSNVCKMIGLIYQKLPELNKSSNNKTDFHDYYNYKTQKIISERYSQDIINFSYSFKENIFSNLSSTFKSILHF